MNNRLGASAVVLATLLLPCALFAPYVARGERFFAVPTESFPPFLPAATAAPPRPADWGATDQLVFMRPNYDRWKKAVQSDVGGLFWNPYHLAGTPFLATQDTFALYPANAFAFLGDGNDVFAWTAALHVLIAAAGTYLGLRRLGLRRAGAWFGGAAFAAGPWMVAHFDYPNFPQAAAWAPWILYAADRAARERRTRDRALLAAVVALSCYAGMIQLTVIALLAAGLCAVARAAAEARAAGAAAAPRALLSAGAGVFVGLLFAAPQLLPLADYAGGGARMAQTPDDLRPRCVRPAEWLATLQPDLFGSPPLVLRHTLEGRLRGVEREQDYPAAAVAGLRGPDENFVESAFAPYAVALVALLAAAARRPRAALCGAALAALGAALAADTPLFELFHGLPGLAFGSPRRWLMLVALGGAALSAAGADAEPSRLGRVLAALPALLLGGATAVAAFGGDALARWCASRGVGAEAAAGAGPTLVYGCGISAVFATLAWAACFVRGGVRPWALGALLVAEAVVFQVRHNPGQERTPFPRPSATTDALRAGEPPDAPTSRRVARLLGDAAECRALGFEPTPHLLAANLASLYDVRDVHGYEGVLSRLTEEAFEALEPGVVRHHHRIETFERPETASRPFLDFLGVGPVLSQRGAAPPGLRTRAVLPAERLAVFDNEGARPTESAVRTARVFDDEAALLRVLGGPDFAPATEALLLRADAARLGLPPPDADGRIVLGSGAGENVDVLRRGAADGAFRVAGDGLRLFVAAESFDPGWSYATASGAPLPLVRANHAFHAVLVPPGVDAVERRYRPRLWTAALVSAAVGLVLLAADSRLLRRRAAASAPAPVGP